MPEQMRKQLERWDSPWVAAAEAVAVPRRQRRSQSAGEGERVGCCF